MKFDISASSWHIERHESDLKKYNYDGESIEINSLQELINLTKDVGWVIFDEDSIEIYDNYRE